MQTKLVIVDDNEEFLTSLVEFFADSSEFKVVATATNGEDALDVITATRPDVVLLDLVMPRLDGYGVLEQLSPSQKVIVMSALSGENFITKATELGAKYYIMKPFRNETLVSRINDCIRGSTASRIKNKTLEEKITNIFITVGIPAHIKGYQFLREAIKMAIDNPDVINSITKRLYPEVARRFDTSPSKVERAIRHAIEVAWNRGKIENINSLFGVRVYNHNEKPTNGEFIALVADKMLLESV
ncbi:MAG: sporulation transcription factor Spo0A [Clostridia bacterium]|nr:sporulation transcription factor Spo0A [Clostridia bacterium]